MEVRNKRWDEDVFLREHHRVLTEWPTGKEIDLDEAIEYRKQIPKERRITEVLDKARSEHRPCLMAAAGHTLLSETLDHFKACEEAGLEWIMLECDTYTRKHRFEQAQQALDESLKQNKSLTNGFPIVAYGLKPTRQLAESVNIPVMGWCCSDEDARLMAEFALAAGMDNGSHDLHGLIQHSKNYSLPKKIQDNQFSQRLAAYYTERGAPVTATVPANLQGYEPIGLKIVHDVIQSVLTAEQGVKTIIPELMSTCHLEQDVAGLRVQRQLVQKYLHRLGYRDVKLYYGYWSPNQAWPRDYHQACAYHAWNIVSGILGDADVIWMKSPEEAIGVTGADGTVAATKIARQLIKTLGKQRLAESKELLVEERMLRLEVEAIVDKVLELGDGDMAIGEIRAAEIGVLDNPFPSWKGVKGKVLPIRDNTGAVRYLDKGNLPLPKEVMEYHQAKIAERERGDGRKADIEMVVSDITRMT